MSERVAEASISGSDHDQREVMMNQPTVLSTKHWTKGLSALAFVLVSCGGLVGCSGGDPSVSTTAGNAPSSSSSSAAIDTWIPGEQFASLDVSSQAVSGVFVKGDQSLAFDVDQANGASVLRLSSATGEVLYSVSKGPTGFEMRVGSGYHSSMPFNGEADAASTPTRSYSPAGFRATGNLQDALKALKTSSLALLPSLAAALGRVGLDGASAPITLSIHLTAERLTEELGLKLDQAVLEATNQLIATRREDARAGGVAASPNQSQKPSLTPSPSAPGELHTEGLQPGGPASCPSGRPPCAAGKIVPSSGPFAGCCMAAPPPPPPAESTADYSHTPSCASGAGREVFQYLDYNPNDPCRDDCLGMCGPGCSPWLWVCQDEAVHVACWNHDRAYCPGWFSGPWGIPIPNPDYPVCMAEYGVYSLEIGASTILGPLCTNNVVSDALTTPPFGLWTLVPNYYETYR